MTISVQLPDDAAARLRAALGSEFDRAALEAIGLEAYRRGAMSIGALAAMLGLGVIETDRWLAERGVPLGYSSPADLQADSDTLRRLVPEPRA